MTEDILNMMKQRRQMKNNIEEYNKLNKEIKHKCKKTNEDWLNAKCNEIEKYHHRNTRDTHLQIKEINRQRAGSQDWVPEI